MHLENMSQTVFALWRSITGYLEYWIAVVSSQVAFANFGEYINKQRHFTCASNSLWEEKHDEISDICLWTNQRDLWWRLKPDNTIRSLAQTTKSLHLPQFSNDHALVNDQQDSL